MRHACRDFQYPLRAYRVWNGGWTTEYQPGRFFQYPLRAYRVWNAESDAARKK